MSSRGAGSSGKRTAQAAKVTASFHSSQVPPEQRTGKWRTRLREEARMRSGKTAEWGRGNSGDTAPFSIEQFRTAPLTKLSGLGGHQPIFRTSMGGSNYFVKQYDPHVKEESPVNEVGARQVAKIMGLQDYTLPVWHTVRDGVEYMVAPLVPNKQSVAQAIKDEHVSAREVWNRIPLADRERLALHAYVTGDPDRIGPNFLAMPDGRIVGIDYSRAMDSDWTAFDRVSNTALVKQGMNPSGVKNAWRHTPLPVAVIQRDILDHEGAIRAVLTRDGHSNSAVQGMNDRLRLLRSMVESKGQPTWGDFYRKAKHYRPGLYQSHGPFIGSSTSPLTPRAPRLPVPRP